MNVYENGMGAITPIFDPITDLDLITEFDFLTNCERFP